MNEAMQSAQVASKPGSRNWWKIGFFLALFAFELVREVAVVSAASHAHPEASGRGILNVTSDARQRGNEWVRARGAWKRIDAKVAVISPPSGIWDPIYAESKIIPGITTIECHKEMNKCFVSSVEIHRDIVSYPKIGIYESKFTERYVTYTDYSPLCYNYIIKIEFNSDKISAFGHRKNFENSDCAQVLEEVRLAFFQGEVSGGGGPDGHFVPIISTAATIVSALEGLAG